MDLSSQNRTRRIEGAMSTYGLDHYGALALANVDGVVELVEKETLTRNPNAALELWDPEIPGATFANTSRLRTHLGHWFKAPPKMGISNLQAAIDYCESKVEKSD